MIYLFQVTVYSALLYVVYLLVLKNHASHSWNRIYLLLCAVLPLIMPFITIPAFSNSISAGAAVLNKVMPEITVFAKSKMAIGSNSNWGDLLTVIYLMVAFAILVRTIIQYISFRHFVKNASYEVTGNVNILLNTKTGPGSFQNYIFFPGNIIEPAIFEHELAHIRLKHTVDILLLRMLHAIFWPNIVLYMINRELKIVHEFQADAYASADAHTYTQALLNETFHTNQFSLSHTFSHHPLKRRIMMLQKPRATRATTRALALRTSLITVLLLSVVVYLQSCNQKDKMQSSATDEAMKQKIMDYTEKIDKNAAQQGYNGKAFAYADKMPEPTFKLSTYLATNIKYPESARAGKKSGRVIIRFIVNEEGEVTNASILRGVDDALDNEALRVVKQMPHWKPGEKGGKKVPVYFTLPIAFKLQ